MNKKLIAMAMLLILALSSCTSKSSDGKSESQPGTVQDEYIELADSVITDKLKGAWVGQMAGVVWGANDEFKFQGKTIPDDKVPDFSSLDINGAFYQDDIYVEITYLEAMEKNGYNCSLDVLAEAFKNSQYPLDHANKIGRENLQKGINAPLSGNYQYNYHSDDIDWQINADFIGQMYAGLPSKAAERAFEVGHITNYGDGVYGGVFVAAMHAKAYTATSVEEIYNTGLSAIPDNTKFKDILLDVKQCYESGKTWTECWQFIQDKWAEKDRCLWYMDSPINIDAKLNSAYILIGLMYGEGDFEKSVKISMQCGQDSDCNPSSVGAILGNFLGYKALPAKYKYNVDFASTKFSYTNYTLSKAISVNNQFIKDIYADNGFTEENGVWKIKKDTESFTVPYEQWEDMPSGELKVQIVSDSTVSLQLKAKDINGPVSVTWDMGDGKVLNENISSYTYKNAGKFTIKCTVTNVNNKSLEFTETVEITNGYTPVDTGTGVRNIAPLGLPLCSVSAPAGSGSRDINVIRDGVKPGKGATANLQQYDTYTGVVSSSDDYIGFLFDKNYKISVLNMTEGMHFPNGGWFANGSIKIEVYQIDASTNKGTWKTIEFTASPEYPKGNEMSLFGTSFEEYKFTFNEVECAGIRIIGKAGGSAAFFGVAELEVIGIEAE
jgi:ADP-ribosylglycohydrolase